LRRCSTRIEKAFSVCHTDKASIEDAQAKLNGKGCAVVCIDPDTVADGELKKLHRLGARGVRLNLQSREQHLDWQEFQRVLFAYADRIRPLGWALQIFCALEQLNLIAPIIPTLQIPVIIDHLGSPHPARGLGRSQAGY
jgi:predicted TIM-barrel fold metal-dependent hydrolase